MVEIRPWQLEDLEACHALADQKDADIVWTIAHYQSSLCAGHVGFVALHETQIIGCLVAHLVFEVADLLYIYVSPHWQGTGAAHQLMSHLVQHCQKYQVHRVILEVRPSNQRALAFYRKHRFINIARRKAYYAATDKRTEEDALILQLCLS